MAYERGLLKGPNLSEVQEKMLLVALSFQLEERREELEYKFEQDLLIHRPEAYEKYREAKEAEIEENLGYDQIVWTAPSNEDEARELMEAVARAHEQFDPNDAEDEEFNQRLEALSQFKNIDISLLGDEDG